MDVTGDDDSEELRCWTEWLLTLYVRKLPGSML